MSCKFDEKLLYAYVDKTIEPLEKIFVEEHLKYCEKCREEVEFIKLMDAKIKEGFSETHEPKNLDDFVDLILDNCMNEVDEDLNLSVQNYFKDMNAARKSLLECYSVMYKNPYNEALNKAVMFPVKETQKALKSYIDKKVPLIGKIKKLLKVG
ncbi:MULTISPECIES: anti-sigma factor family protein [Clostridium]|uniref:anti-sigma factor family protein n=1 Tax=Clostridium TaxID=1485 RepID=UPI000824F4A8|nr:MULTISPECIES: zf-HC2 domain-containing protein [Clostridium]PJI08736.1 hypothetical protein CUB90_13050 [Clostridium sp. CT7]